MTGGEDGAAVLVREDGGFVGADLTGDADDFHLVGADEGAQDRQGGHVLGDAQRHHGLTGHLAQRFAGDQSVSAGLFGHGLGNAHHEAAHDEGEVFLGAVSADFLLDLGEGDHMDQHPAAVGGQILCQLDHLVLCLLGGVGRRFEVDHLQLHAAAGDHPAGNGGVQTAGEEAYGTAAGAHWQTACAGNGGRVDIGCLLADLHIDRQVRLVHVHGHMGKGLGQLAAHGLRDLDGVEVEQFVGALALHLEGAGGGKLVGQVGLGGLHDGVDVLLAGDGPGDGHHAEDLLGSLVGGLHITVVLLRLHVDGTLTDVDLKTAAGLHAVAHGLDQLILKGAAVQTLQNHFAQLQQKHFVVVH